MSEFEFFFSFYGLLLGLCAAQIASGIGHAIVARRDSHLGWLTPLLSAFLLMDLASFWLNAWNYRRVMDVSFASLYAGMLIALSYYIAAVLLFPVRERGWSNLDEHYWQNKKWVVLGVALANAAALAWFVGSKIVQWPTQAIFLMAAYWLPLVLLFFSRRKWLDAVSLTLLIAAYVWSLIAELG